MQNKIEVCNPFDLSKVGEIELVNAEIIERYLNEAHSIFQNKRQQLAKYERINILRRTAGLMKDIEKRG